jgi:hypothetical protein
MEILNLEGNAIIGIVAAWLAGIQDVHSQAFQDQIVAATATQYELWAKFRFAFPGRKFSVKFELDPSSDITGATITVMTRVVMASIKYDFKVPEGMDKVAGSISYNNTGVAIEDGRAYIYGITNVELGTILTEAVFRGESLSLEQVRELENIAASLLLDNGQVAGTAGDVVYIAGIDAPDSANNFFAIVFNDRFIGKLVVTLNTASTVMVGKLIPVALESAEVGREW